MPHYPADWTSTMQPALRAYVVASLGAGWSVIWGAQQGPGALAEGPRPPKPYAVLRALTVPTAEGRPSVLPVEVSPTQMDLRATVPGVFTFEVQLFADTDQRAALSGLRMDLAMWNATDPLRQAGLQPREVLAERDISQVFAGSREFRYVLEVRMGCEIRRELADQPFVSTVGSTVMEVS